MVPSIRLYQENRLNMEPFFTRVIPFDEGLDAFDLLGLDMKTLKHHPKSAMKIVMKM
jgi:threonine dehydrogenase-like Zn-dependent dehydrogenase